MKLFAEGANMAQYDDPDLFVFLDESSVNNKTTQHIASWSHLGIDRYID